MQQGMQALEKSEQEGQGRLWTLWLAPNERPRRSKGSVHKSDISAERDGTDFVNEWKSRKDTGSEGERMNEGRKKGEAPGQIHEWRKSKWEKVKRRNPESRS